MTKKKRLDAKTKKIHDLEYTVNELKRDLRYAREERDKAIAQAEKYEFAQKLNMGERNVVREENDWLKDTLRLVIIEKGKLPELKELIEKDRQILYGGR